MSRGVYSELNKVVNGWNSAARGGSVDRPMTKHTNLIVTAACVTSATIPESRCHHDTMCMV